MVVDLKTDMRSIPLTKEEHDKLKKIVKQSVLTRVSEASGVSKQVIHKVCKTGRSKVGTIEKIRTFLNAQ